MTANERRLLDELGARASGCPEADRLAAYEAGELDGAARETIEAHLDACEVCNAAVRFLTAEVDGGDIPDGVVQRSEEWIASVQDREMERPASIRRWALAAMAVAAVVFLVFILPIQLPTEETTSPPLRDPGFETVRSLLPDLPLSRDDCRLRWSSGPQGSVYTVTLFTENLRPIETVEGLGTPEYVVPQQTLDALDDDTFFWRVEVFPPDAGRRFSGTFAARLEP